MKSYFKNTVISFICVFCTFFQLHTQQLAVVSVNKRQITPDSIEYKISRHPEIKIALALSGGGTRGIAHVALLEEFQRNGIPIYGISGTSIGGVVGALYASGYSPKDIHKIFKHFNWDELYSDQADRTNVIVPEKEQQNRFLFQLGINKDGLYFPSSLSHGQRILDLFTRYTSHQTILNASNYDHLSPKLAIIATDMLSGQRIVFRSGNLANNMLASMAFPLLFSPVEYDSMLLIDGGISDNIPVDAARQIGGNFIVASDVTAGLRKRDKLNLPWEIADQVTTIMMQRNVERAVQADLVISPDLKQFTSTDFNSMEYFYQEGKSSARNSMETLYKEIQHQFKINIRPVYVEAKQQRVELYSKDRLLFVSESKSDSILNLSFLYQKLMNKYRVSSAQFFYSPPDKKLTIKLHYTCAARKIQIDSKDKKLQQKILNLLEKNEWMTCLSDTVIRKKFQMVGRELDYLALHINMEKHKDHFFYHLEPIYFDSIHITGNHRTKKYIIKRELKPSLFKAATINDLIESLKNVYGSGLFYQVEFFPLKMRNRSVLKIHVKEKPYLLARFGLHYNQDLQTEIIMNIQEKNIFGRQIKFSSEFLIGPERRIGKVFLNSNRIYNTNWDFEINLQHSRETYPIYKNREIVRNYIVENARTEFTMGKLIEKLGHFKGTIYLQQKEGPVSELTDGSEIYRLWGLSFSTVVDNRDARYFAQKGYYFKLVWKSLNYVSPSHLNTAKMWIKYEGYGKIAKYTTLSPFFSGGIAENTLPYISHFFTDMNNRSSGQHLYEQSGKMFITIGGEWRQQVFPYFWGEKYLSLRIDLNGFWKSSEEQIHSKDLKPGAAIGFHVVTILGPLEFRYEIREKYTPFTWINLGFYF